MVGWWLWMDGVEWDVWDGGLSGMEENKKSGGGDVRAEALSWDGEWDKAENEFSPLYPHSPATVARDARPSHPSPYRKKSRFAKKKSAPPKKNTPAVFF